MASTLDRLRRQVQRLIVPTSDLGMSQSDVGPLSLMDDVPVVLAVNALMTPTGPRLMQAPSSGYVGLPSRSYSIQHPSAAEVATWVGPSFDASQVNALLALMVVTAISGTAPTARLVLQGSWDNGTTWNSLAGPASINANGSTILVAGVGTSSAAPNIITNFAGINGPLPPLCRIEVVITGTGPSVTFAAYLVTQ